MTHSTISDIVRNLPPVSAPGILGRDTPPAEIALRFRCAGVTLDQDALIAAIERGLA